MESSALIFRNALITLTQLLPFNPGSCPVQPQFDPMATEQDEREGPSKIVIKGKCFFFKLIN